MKLWTSLLVAAALLIATGTTATAGMRYLDRAPMIAKAKHRVLTERVIAHRERVFARQRRERQEARAAARAASVAQEPSSATQTAPVAPSYPASSGALTSEQVASYARAAGFPESVISTMVSIAYRESNFIPTAVNSSSGACGLWQLYPCPGSWALTPSGNAAGAYAKYQASGLSPWATTAP